MESSGWVAALGDFGRAKERVYDFFLMSRRVISKAPEQAEGV